MKKILVGLTILLSLSVVGCSEKFKFNPEDIDIDLSYKIEDSFDPSYKNAFFSADVKNNTDFIISYISIDVAPIYGDEEMTEEKRPIIIVTNEEIGKNQMKSLNPTKREVVVDYDDDIKAVEIKEVSITLEDENGNDYNLIYDGEGNIIEKL